MMQDLRYATRWLLRNRLFTIAATFTIALAIGSNAAVFSIVNTALFQPLPYKDSDRLIEINDDNERVTLDDYEELWRHTDFLESVASYKVKVWHFSGHGEPIRIPGFSVSSSLFPLLKVQPAMGRNFTYEEDHSASPFVALISDEMWHAVFAADPQILGKVIALDGQPCEIIGVMPPNFKYPNTIIKQPQFWTTLGYDKAHRLPNSLQRVYTIGRLKTEITMVEAQEKLNVISKIFKGRKHQFKIAHLNEFSKRNLKYTTSILILVSSGVLLVLLIACSNIASLLLSKAIIRKKEIAVRVALGASRGKLMKQLLTESLLLCSLGGVSGFLLAYWLRDSIKIWLGSIYPVAVNYFTGIYPKTINFRILVFTAFVTILTGLITGLVPAWNASKTDLISALKEGRQTSSQDSHGRNLHNLFVVLQLAMALLLLTGAGLMIRSVSRLQKVDIGFDPNFVEVFVALPSYKYPEPAQWEAFSAQFLERARALPGVQYAAITTDLPLLMYSGSGYVSIQTEDQPNLPPDDDNSTHYTCATSDFFKTVGARLIAGRTFSESEEKASAPVIIVNEAFAGKFFAGKNPIGRRVRLSFETPLSAEVIGIIKNMKQQLDAETDPQIYFSYHLQPRSGITLIARGNFLATDMITLLTKQAWAIDSQVPIFDAISMTEAIRHASMDHRSIMFLFTFFAIVAVCLAIVGIYSVTSYSISRQTHEIGIRMSVGAQKQDVVWMILKKAIWLIGAGISIGLIFSFSLNHTLKYFIYGISRNDPATYVVVSLLVVVIALIASAIPALRATRVDPVVALREE